MEKSEAGVNKNFQHQQSFADEATAKSRFRLAAARLLDVNTWHLRAGKGTAVFQRMDSNGFALSGPLQDSDYIRIDIPGPGHSKGFDWVKVEEIAHSDNRISIRVRPCSDPTVKDSDTAHFLSEAATSTFIVEKAGLNVTAVILGRNEQPNNDGESILQKARDLLVSIGAIAGASDIQWNKLAKGLLEDEDKDADQAAS